MNDNMDAAPRDGTVLNLRLADGDKTSGRFAAPAGSLGYWVGMDGRVLIPQPRAWSPITS